MVIIGSGSGLAPNRCQATIWIKYNYLSIGLFANHWSVPSHYLNCWNYLSIGPLGTCNHIYRYCTNYKKKIQKWHIKSVYPLSSWFHSVRLRVCSIIKANKPDQVTKRQHWIAEASSFCDFHKQCCTEILETRQYPGDWINIKMPSYQYRKSHCGDKTILRPSYLHNGLSYTGKMTSLYWIRALIFTRQLMGPRGYVSSLPQWSLIKIADLFVDAWHFLRIKFQQSDSRFSIPC